MTFIKNTDIESDAMTKSANHDLPLGRLHNCQICSSANLEQILDLGHQAPCDSLLTQAQMDQPEAQYPLRLVRCGDCGLVQIDYVVDPTVLFHKEYPYRSGITATLTQNLHRTTQVIVETYKLKPGSLTVDIGSNDGTLLQGFKNQGMRPLGIEATNIAQIAIRNGIETVQAFFSEAVGRQLTKSHGQAMAITATNMFAHVNNLGDLMRGVDALLAPGGVFVTESHYLLDLLETNQFDSIYHEHLKYYSIRPLIELMRSYDFSVTDVERIPNYGGSIRVYAEKGVNRPMSPRMKDLLALEAQSGLNAPERYVRFAEEVRENKLALQELLLSLKRQGKPVPGIGCPGRSSTLLNYCGVDPDWMPYIAEQSTSLKLGMFLPGTHVPIVDEKRLFEEQPEYAMILSWHYAAPIIRKLREAGLRSKIIVPLPHVQIVE